MVTIRYANARARPYQLAPGTSVLRPMLRVRLGHGSRRTPQFLALLDSGADMSMFHVDLATYLGIDLSGCRTALIGGVGGQVSTHNCSVQLEIEHTSFTGEVMFSSQVASTVALLGRQSVFDQFQFGFDQRSNLLLFDPY